MTRTRTRAWQYQSSYQWRFTGKLEHTLDSKSKFTLSLAASDDGKYLATGAIDGIINVFDLVSRKLVHTLEGHAMPIRSLGFARTAPNYWRSLMTVTLNCTTSATPHCWGPCQVTPPGSSQYTSVRTMNILYPAAAMELLRFGRWALSSVSTYSRSTVIKFGVSSSIKQETSCCQWAMIKLLMSTLYQCNIIIHWI